MDGILAGKLAVVTGGGRRLAAPVARVVCCVRTKQELDALAREIGGVAMPIDLTNRSETDEVIASLGHVDLLFNNAGVAESAALERTTDEIWDRILELDVT